MGNIRGIAIASSVRFVREKFGEEGLSKVLENLSEQDRKILSSTLEAMRWYSVSTLENFMVSADKILGKGDLQLCSSMGVYAAQEAFGGLYKMFLELGKPHTVLRRAPLAWRLLNDTGDFELEVLKDNYAKAKISGFENPHKAHCFRLVGYFQRVLELSGAKNVKVRELKCKTEGADWCEYEASWE